MSDHQLDWTILRDGGVALYWWPEVPAEDMNSLRSMGYRTTEFDAGDWKSEEQMHECLQSEQCFPDYYTKNLDVLNDRMSVDVAIPEEVGLVLVLRRYDQFAKTLQIEMAHARSLAELMPHVFARRERPGHVANVCSQCRAYLAFQALYAQQPANGD